MENFNPSETILINVDMQRGFMPANEYFPAENGYGELPVDGGHGIVETVNQINSWAMQTGIETVTTQDWHPTETAHFGDKEMQWPDHCIADTEGAKFHQQFKSEGARPYKKGQEAITSPEDDTSYSGFNAIDETGESLGEYVQRAKKTGVIVVGIALGGKDFDTCVDSTAMDFAVQTEAEVFVVRDATAAIVASEQKEIEMKLERSGVQLVDSKELLEG